MSLPLVSHPTATDPVCGMQVDPATAPAHTNSRGTEYYFCCPHCLQKFQADPEKYLAAPGSEAHAAPAAPAAPGVEYVCPMDPEVRSDRPGPCPKCGMALEPRVATPDAGPNPELKEMERRFWIGLVFGLPLIVNAMSGMLLRHPLLAHGVWELALAGVVAYAAGRPIFERAWASLLNRSPNMFTLIGLGVTASLLGTLLGFWDFLHHRILEPAEFERHEALTQLSHYAESAASILVLTLLGQVLELRARER